MALDDLTKEKNSIALTSLLTDNDLGKKLDEVDFSMIIEEIKHKIILLYLSDKKIC